MEKKTKILEGIFSEYEMDSLHILPLSIIPFNNNQLSFARLIKNTKLETMVELFKGENTGSGQVNPVLIHEFVHFPEGKDSKDYKILQFLSSLGSFDVFNLRYILRKNSIPIKDSISLSLSKSKEEELNEFMSSFTRPLTEELFGENYMFKSVSNLVGELNGQDKQELLHKLTQLSERLNIEISELPDFLENYGDIYLSLVFFKSVFYELKPQFDSLCEDMNQLREHQYYSQNKQLISSCKEIENNIGKGMEQLLIMLEDVTDNEKFHWSNINAQSFSEMRSQIFRDQIKISNLACGLYLKIRAWDDAFGSSDSGSASRKVDYLLGFMIPGTAEIRRMAEEAIKK